MRDARSHLLRDRDLPKEMEKRLPQKRKKPVVLGYTGRGEPYLYLRQGLKRKDGTPRDPDWVIRHKSKQIGTGCSRDEAEQALERLEEYKASIYEPIDELGLPASRVLIADALSRYLDAKIKSVSNPKDLISRMRFLTKFWGEKALSEITRRSIEAYVESRSTPYAARRELEDLRAATTLAFNDGLCRDLIKFKLPDPPIARTRWLTRSEAAKLLRAAWFKKERQKGSQTSRRTGKHVAKFILVALRSGTRASAICDASFYPEKGRPWVETRIDNGEPIAIFHRLALDTREKKNKRYPAVKLPPKLAQNMHRWKRNGQRYVVEWNGRPAGSTKKAFRRIVDQVGLEDVCRHTLRHTAATWMMQDPKVTIFEASGYLGMSVQILTDKYAHHSPDHMKNAIAALNR